MLIGGKKLRIKYGMSSKLAVEFLLKRSKVDWIKLGDDKTKWFYFVQK